MYILPFHYMTIHGFIYHALIILYPWLLFVSGNVRPRTKHIWQPVLFLCCIVPPVYLFNKKFDSNYMFINYPPANTPLKVLADQIGNPGYLLGYAIFIFFMILILYQIFNRFQWSYTRNSPNHLGTHCILYRRINVKMPPKNPYTSVIQPQTSIKNARCVIPGIVTNRFKIITAAVKLPLQLPYAKTDINIYLNLLYVFLLYLNMHKSFPSCHALFLNIKNSFLLILKS